MKRLHEVAEKEEMIGIDGHPRVDRSPRKGEARRRRAGADRRDQRIARFDGIETATVIARQFDDGIVRIVQSEDVVAGAAF